MTCGLLARVLQWQTAIRLQEVEYGRAARARVLALCLKGLCLSGCSTGRLQEQLNSVVILGSLLVCYA
jgi:hypothetical protein